MLHFEFKGFLSDESARDTKALGEQVKSKVMDDAIRRVDRARKDEDVVEIEKDGTFEGGETTPVIPVE